MTASWAVVIVAEGFDGMEYFVDAYCGEAEGPDGADSARPGGRGLRVGRGPADSSRAEGTSLIWGMASERT